METKEDINITIEEKDLALKHWQKLLLQMLYITIMPVMIMLWLMLGYLIARLILQ